MISRYQSQQMRDIWTLQNRYHTFLKVELASIHALAKEGKISLDTAQKIDKTTFDLKEILNKEKVLKHDVLAFIETCRESLGDEKKYFHYGLTSTDVVDTSMSLLLKEANQLIDDALQRFLKATKQTIKNTKNMPIMARTHGMYAEVSTVGMRYLRLFETMKRLEIQFFEARKHIEVIKLSGAVGTYSILSRQHECLVRDELQLQDALMSTQVLSRDRHLTYIQTLSTMASVIEGFALDIRLYSRSDVSEIKEGFSNKQKGSSAMPHKKNPITSENLTGLARLMRGYVTMASENIALWHERDISHSSVERVMLEDATSLMETIFTRVTKMIESLVYDQDQMHKHIIETYETAFTQKILHLAIDEGLDRIETYEKLQAYSFEAIKNKTKLTNLLRKDAFFESIQTKLDDVTNMNTIVSQITSQIDTFLEAFDN
ncbi:MAG: adenylosuccinate lyase [Acholeplasmataceae bacterium]